MNVIMLLADSAQVASGKLYVLGGGWSLTGPDPSPSALAIKISLDPHELDHVHHWHVALEDADGRNVTVPLADGAVPLRVGGEFSVSGDTHAPTGSMVDVPLAINFAPLALDPASRFVWRLEIDGETPPGGFVAFTTRSRN